MTNFINSGLEGNSTISLEYLIPIKKALQGHPESQHLWDEHFSNILTNKMRLIHTNNTWNLQYPERKRQEASVRFARTSQEDNKLSCTICTEALCE